MQRQYWEPAISDRSFYTLYLANRDGRDFLQEERQSAFDIVRARFPSFTTLNGQGYFKGKPLPTLIFQIATKDRYSLAELCNELCVAFDQKWIGLSDGSSYRSVSRRAPVPSDKTTISDMVL